jgi:O-antigen/teichoic acid export membrane protein
MRGVITIKIEITKKDISWNYFNYVINFGLSFAILPLLYRLLNANEIGFWFVLVAIGGLTEILDMGFSTIISRNVSYVVSGGTKIQTETYNRVNVSDIVDYRLLTNLISASRKIYQYLSLLVLLFLSTIGTFYVYSVSFEELPTSTFLTAWGIYVFAVIVRILFSYWNHVLRGVGAIKESNKATIISKLLQFVFSYGLVFWGFGVIGLSLGYLIGILSQRTVSAWYFLHYEDYKSELKKYKYDTNKVDSVKDIIKSLRTNVLKQGQITLSYYLINKSIVIISSIYFGLSVAGMIGFTHQLLSLVSSVGNSLFNAYLPQFTSERLNKNNYNLYKKLTLSLGISFSLILFSGVFLAFLGNPLFNMLKMNVTVLPTIEMIAFLVMYLLINNHFLCGTFIASSNNLTMHTAYSISAGIMIISQLLLSYLFPFMGVWSLILPGLIVQSFYNNWKWPYEVAKEFSVSISKMIKDTIIMVFKTPHTVLKNKFERGNF